MRSEDFADRLISYGRKGIDRLLGPSPLSYHVIPTQHRIRKALAVMNLFIDTNVFLSFYHFTSDDLEELDKLSVLIRQEEVNLYVPEQVIDEFRRNRDSKIDDALDRLRDQDLNLQFPQLCKDYDEYGRLRKLQHQYKEKHSELIDNITKDVWDRALNADSTVDELFEEANTYETTEELLKKARNRMDIGNPPGKQGSLGDAINWEVLLSEVPEGEDLYFISDDRDFFSPLDKNRFNSFLLEEWESKKAANIIFYKRLSSFFRDEFPDIELASEFEKELLIQELMDSGSFEQTHNIISGLDEYSEFTSAQINDIVEAYISNTQIYWIIEDDDVYSFIETVISGNKDIIDEDSLEELRELMGEDDSEAVEEVFELDDDLPF